MRVVNDGYCHSFEEYMKVNKIEPKSKVKKDDKKFEESQNKFLAHHKCRTCHQPMQFLTGTNTMVCRNESCRGVKQVRKDKDGNEIVSYLPSYEVLEDKWASYASYLFVE